MSGRERKRGKERQREGQGKRVEMNMLVKRVGGRGGRQEHFYF